MQKPVDKEIAEIYPTATLQEMVNSIAFASAMMTQSCGNSIENQRKNFVSGSRQLLRWAEAHSLSLGELLTMVDGEYALLRKEGRSDA